MESSEKCNSYENQLNIKIKEVEGKDLELQKLNEELLK